MNDRTGKILRTIGILFFGLATVMNLLGGIGTSCAAFLTENYPSFSALIIQGRQWLYQGLVVATVVIALVGISVLIELIRGGKKSFRHALIVLMIGTILAGIQYFSSLQLFGKAAPANVKFYINLITLIIFLIYLIPGIRNRVKFSSGNRGNEKNAARGLAAIMIGFSLLTIPVWAELSHTYQGVNWVHLLQTELIISGVLLIGVGAALILRVVVDGIGKEKVYKNLKIPHSY
jgi:hypothetical protein